MTFLLLQNIKYYILKNVSWLSLYGNKTEAFLKISILCSPEEVLNYITVNKFPSFQQQNAAYQENASHINARQNLSLFTTRDTTAHNRKWCHPGHRIPNSTRLMTLFPSTGLLAKNRHVSDIVVQLSLTNPCPSQRDFPSKQQTNIIWSKPSLRRLTATNRIGRLCFILVSWTSKVHKSGRLMQCVSHKQSAPNPWWTKL